MGVYFMGVYFMGVYFMGVYLTGMHLMGVYVMGAYLIRLQGARLCARCTPVYVRCTSTRYTPPWVHYISGRCTSVKSSLPVNVYEISGNFDFRKLFCGFL